MAKAGIFARHRKLKSHNKW